MKFDTLFGRKIGVTSNLIEFQCVKFTFYCLNENTQPHMTFFTKLFHNSGCFYVVPK